MMFGRVMLKKRQFKLFYKKSESESLFKTWKSTNANCLDCHGNMQTTSRPAQLIPSASCGKVHQICTKTCFRPGNPYRNVRSAMRGSTCLCDQLWMVKYSVWLTVTKAHTSVGSQVNTSGYNKSLYL